MSIESCTCKSDYQDRKYGAGKRVKNRSGKKGETHKVRCTVCGIKDEKFNTGKKK